MEKNLQNHYQNVTIYDLLTKLNFKNIFEIPKITKICLNIGFKDANIEKKKLINIILLLKLITNQKPIITKSKKNIIFLKIKKNSIIGCKITLRKKKIFNFLEKFLIFVLQNITKINFNFKNKNILNFQIQNILYFFELKTEFLKFKNIPPIDVSIHTNAKNSNELFLLLNSLFIIKK
ncbi:ribosomal protein L5 (mitochondrion) [Phytophthora citrophthora]|uniref:50S ribosomal protein L5, chloroplastic n=1 Tax=Phytophthora citrophthora TaxID=4793 RepID=A0AAD9L9Q6_9STRA|nr:ribosomal protein L5 [Phytophthora citrophthora]KAK1928418.1 ribosomal protein L5 [Phytophthora citrophthora]UXG55871.1 ribosomal protein L5 [Phytophthora citrophthora]